PGFGVVLEGLGDLALRGTEGFGAGHGLILCLEESDGMQSQGQDDAMVVVKLWARTGVEVVAWLAIEPTARCSSALSPARPSAATSPEPIRMFVCEA
ncbi:hypothetical protein DF107_35655, partial [Burkholderia stagnalis]